MPPLKNIKHEKFAKAVIEKPSYSQAYQEAYAVETHEVARAASSRLLTNVSVRNRIQEIMRETELDEGSVVKKLRQFVNSEKEMIGLEATKTALKIYGAFEDPEDRGQRSQNIQILVGNFTNGEIGNASS